MLETSERGCYTTSTDGQSSSLLVTSTCIYISDPSLVFVKFLARSAPRRCRRIIPPELLISYMSASRRLIYRVTDVGYNMRVCVEVVFQMFTFTNEQGTFVWVLFFVERTAIVLAFVVLFCVATRLCDASHEQRCVKSTMFCSSLLTGWRIWSVVGDSRTVDR